MPVGSYDLRRCSPVQITAEEGRNLGKDDLDSCLPAFLRGRAKLTSQFGWGMLTLWMGAGLSDMSLYCSDMAYGVVLG